MKKIFLFIPFALLLSVFFVSCEKEYSFENGGVPSDGGASLAVFSFSGGTGNCAGAVASGTYKVGNTVTAANTVSLNAIVEETGTYSISTPVQNGISFSGSGSFTATGLQTITLSATGTPTTAGDFNFTAGASGCVFTITVAANSGSSGGTAVYTFDGSPASCSGATTTGDYKAGTALAAGNTVTLGVDVTTVGSYTITSSASNGVSFSGSGNFTTTGPQTITLTGAGTPAAAGDYNFTAGAAGCIFTISFAAATGGGGGGTDFIRCKIDGVDKTFNDGALALDVFGIVTINGSENASSSTTGNLSITLSNLSTMTVTPGTYTINLLGNNCMVAYIPDASSSGTGWASATASQPQGFTVNVTENSATRVSGTFNGTFYDNDGNGTNTKTVTNGEFSVPK